MARVDPHLAKLRAIIARLPEAIEDTPWGSIHWKVRGKIFGGWGRRDDGASSIGVKTDKELQAALVASDPRVTVAAYVGKHGWIDIRLAEKPDWAEVEHFVVDSYRRVAPARLVAQLDGAAPRARAVRPAGPSTRRTAPKRKVRSQSG